MKIYPRRYLQPVSILLLWLLGSATAWSTVVEVPGSALTGLVGQATAAIRVYAQDGSGQFRPIPFQIDERSAEGGAWIMDQEIGKVVGSGSLDPQDVLLFAAEDAGAQAAPSQLDSLAKVYELVVDAASRKAVYVGIADPKAPLAAESYIHYDPAQDRISTTFYEMSFQRAHPLIQNLLLLRNGSQTVDILDRFKVRFNLAIKNFFDFKIDEMGVDAQVTGYRIGPIRVIRRLAASKQLGPIRLIPKTQTDFLFYSNWVEVPTKIRNPIDGPKFLEGKTTGISGYDFSKAVYGSLVYSSLNTAPVTLDGVPAPQETTLSSASLDWWALSGASGSMVVGVQNDPKLAQLGVHPILTILDDAKKSDPPEEESGACFVGFDLPYYKIPKGTYMIQVKQVFPWRFVHSQESTYLQEAKPTAPKEIRQVSGL